MSWVYASMIMLQSKNLSTCTFMGFERFNYLRIECHRKLRQYLHLIEQSIELL